MIIFTGASRLNDLFLDSSFYIALSARSDEHHAKALEVRQGLRQRSLIITRPVLFEVGNALSKLRFRRMGVRLLRSIEADSQIEIVSATDDLYRETLELYASHSDKEWGLTDCLSFAVMRQRGIQEAVTTDRHFEQAGFRALLLD